MSTVPKADDKPTSNVIRFPHRHAQVSPPTSEIARESIEQVKFEHCREAGEFIYEQTMGVALSFGYFINPDKMNAKDMKMVEETIFSALCRYAGVDHPLHDLIDTMMYDEETDELVDVDISDELEDPTDEDLDAIDTERV